MIRIFINKESFKIITLEKEKEEFTDSLYQEGKRIIECLDKEGFNYPVVLWINFPDKKEWTLLFGIPGLKIIGINDILGNIKRIIRENSITITADKISLIDSKDKFCINLKSTIKTGSGIGSLKMSPVQINGMTLPESVIYRVS